jgi:V8-like Glu-specific endopeptidase
MLEFLALTGLARVAFAGAPPPIVGGGATHDYPEVVLIYAENSQGNLATTCTGTIIAGGAVLTAAHCFDGEELGFEVANVYVLEVDSLAEQGDRNTSTATGWQVHPSFDRNSGEHDVALVSFAQNSSSKAAIYDTAPSADDVGRDYTIVGFGLSSESDTSGDLKKREAEVPLYDFDRAFYYTYDQTGKSNACSGDSGGPLFRVSAHGGDYALAGVMNSVSGCTGGSLASARIDEQLDWISGIVSVETVDAYDDGPADKPADEAPGNVDENGDPVEPNGVGCGLGLAASWAAVALAAGAARRIQGSDTNLLVSV